jgi:WD40 repeat protein
MERYATAVLCVLFCAGCGSKPGQNASGNLPPVPATAAMPAGTAGAGHSGATQQDSYGGTFFVVRPEKSEQKAEAVMERTNMTDPDAPIWSQDGEKVYLVFDNENFLPAGKETGHGIFVWERRSGKITQILKDSIGGLTISQDGALAGFWDYSAGNKLTVYNLKTRQVVRAWEGQVHSEDDLIISEMAFAPDGKSLLAELYVPKENPVMQYEIASGKISPFGKNIQSMVTAGNSLYFLQYEPEPFTNPEHAHPLKKWTPGNAEPVTVVEDFPYERLSASGDGERLVGGSAGTWGQGNAIYEMKTGHIQKTGKSCEMAVVTGSGKIYYTFGAELVTDFAVCGGPPPLTSKQDEP